MSFITEEINFSAQLKKIIEKFTQEARNCPALDTCCSSSVAGKPWLDMYVKELSEEDKVKVVGPMKSNKLFKFGNNGMLRSLGKYSIPTKVAGRTALVERRYETYEFENRIGRRCGKHLGNTSGPEDDEFRSPPITIN